MLVVFIIVVSFDLLAIIMHNIRWSNYCSEQREANDAGYENEYTICSKENNVLINGVEYMYFHAHRDAILDGDYNEDILVRYNSEYLDKTSGRTEELILFGNKLSTYNDIAGTRYTIIELYSICDYITGDNTFFGFFNALIVTALGFVFEIALILVYVIHKIIVGVNKNLYYIN